MKGLNPSNSNSLFWRSINNLERSRSDPERQLDAVQEEMKGRDVQISYQKMRLTHLTSPPLPHPHPQELQSTVASVKEEVRH